MSGQSPTAAGALGDDGLARPLLARLPAGVQWQADLMRSSVVEGEPGIFPDPIARGLRAIGRFLSRIGSKDPETDGDEEAPPSSSKDG